MALGYSRCLSRYVVSHQNYVYLRCFNISPPTSHIKFHLSRDFHYLISINFSTEFDARMQEMAFSVLQISSHHLSCPFSA